MDTYNSENDGFSVDTSFTDDMEDYVEPQDTSIVKASVEWLDVLVTAIITVIIVFSFLFRVATIDGRSMQNTLHDGQKIIITKLGYKAKNGDIVVISRNHANAESEGTEKGPIIKRVIAVGGQKVDIDFRKGEVKVDGKVLKENYISTPTQREGDVKFPLTVPEGYVFVMGDNRMDSLDSRFSVIGENGLVDTRYILGHAVYRIFPFNVAGRLDNK